MCTHSAYAPARLPLQLVEESFVKSSPVSLAAVLAAVAGMALSLAGCQGRSTPAAAQGASAASAAAPAVKWVAARPVRSAPREEATGTLFPAQALMLGFEVGGKVAAVRVRKGQSVQAGQVLAVLDTEVADAQVAQAQAGLAAAEVGAAMAADVATRNAKLQEEGNISDLQSRTASTQARQAEAQLLAAKATLAQAQAARRKHELRAPFAATVIDAPEQAGATVGPGIPLFNLERLDTLLLKTTVSESTRALLQPGARVGVESVGSSASTAEATVRTILPSADPATRRVPVELLVPNEDGRFVAHTLARATLPLGEEREAQLLPATALSSSGGDHVWALAGEQVRRVEVQVLERREREVVVLAASPLDKVIEYAAE